MNFFQKTMKLATVVTALATSIVGAVAAPIMHVHDSSGNLGTVDVATGDVNLIGNMGVTMTDIAFDASGNLFGLSFSNLYSINPSTATTALIGAHGISGGNALVFGLDGTLYGAGNTTENLYTIDVLTGAGSNLGNMGFASGGDLAFNMGNFYLASSSNELIQIDLSNLTNTSAVGNFGVSGVFGLATGDDNILYAVAGTTVYEVNTSTGAASDPVSFAGQGLGTAFGQSFVTESGGSGEPDGQVPVPATMLLIGLGLAAARAAYSRRRIVT